MQETQNDKKPQVHAKSTMQELETLGIRQRMYGAVDCCCVVLCCVGLGSHFVYSVRGKGYATVECWGGQVAIVVNKKNQNSTGRWIGECGCGGGS